MSGTACTELLQWALPRLGLKWKGFRRVRRQVCRRIDARIQELGLSGMGAYREYLEAHGEEWSVLDACCTISISRFARDREVFDRLSDTVLPALWAADRTRTELRAWSAGCASGEEPYTLSIYWSFRGRIAVPGVRLRIVGTDRDPVLLDRARAGRYRASSLRELPGSWIDAAFDRDGEDYVLKRQFREDVALLREDVRREAPPGPFDLVLCRNLAFTYFDADLQRATLERLLRELRPGGALVIGGREALPEGACDLSEWLPRLGIYRRLTHGGTTRSAP